MTGTHAEAEARALELLERHGDNAPAYAASRIEAARFAGEQDDVRLWTDVAKLLVNRPQPA